MKKIILFGTLLWSGMLMAQHPARVPAYPGIIERVQPWGDTIKVYLRGDERGHYCMTEDGYLLVEDPKGALYYAKKKSNGEIAAGKKARDKEKRCKCEQKRLEKNGIKVG